MVVLAPLALVWVLSTGGWPENFEVDAFADQKACEAEVAKYKKWDVFKHRDFNCKSVQVERVSWLDVSPTNIGLTPDMIKQALRFGGEYHVLLRPVPRVSAKRYEIYQPVQQGVKPK